VGFTEKEMRLIAAAERRVRNTLCFRCVCAVMMLVNVGLFMLGYMSENHMLMFTVAIMLAAGLYPHWGARTPSYEQLLDILVDKSSAERKAPLLEALSPRGRKSPWERRRHRSQAPRGS
jgi:hypothetical protein